jgi:hypothetical protein
MQVTVCIAAIPHVNRRLGVLARTALRYRTLEPLTACLAATCESHDI